MTDAIRLKLGTIPLDVPFFQASLSGYTDYAMRKLARRFGCPFTFVDMMLAKSAANPRVLLMPCFRPHDDEHPIGAQILGETPDVMAKAARDLVAIGYDLIDMNFACPAPKVLRRGRGGAMLNNPDAVIDNVKAVQDAVSCPVLMKIRIGIDHSTRSSDNFWEIVTRAVELKVDALIIHGRTVSQDYGGKADWEPLAAAKKRFSHMTIIGSGDIHDPAATVGLMQRTGLDGFVVARGAVGNPWIFRDLRCVWENRLVPPPPSLAEQRLILFEHLSDMMHDYPERLCVSRFRKFLAGYTRRHPKRKQVLLDLLKTKTRAEVEAGIDAWYGNAAEATG